MQRDIEQFKGNQFDLLVVGGGIYGVCAAWDAALRGLSVALIEKSDFGSATSSNSLKIIHGGLRYLQHADFRRMRESITERRTLMKIAPHLVHTLQCVMPTYGHALKGREVMAVALLLNDLVGYDRNQLDDPSKHMPAGKVISKQECARIIPGVDQEGLTGGAVWYDCQVRNSERLLLAMLHSAADAGAAVANYVEMTGFRKDGNRITGVTATDRITGEKVDISARLVINNTGPWVLETLEHLNGDAPQMNLQLSVAMNLVVKKKLFPDFAVGLFSKEEFNDDDAVLSKGSRLFFVTPWQEYSLIGTTHVHYDGKPGDFRVSEQDVQVFLDDVNKAYPPAKLTRDDVVFFYGGLLPADRADADTDDVKLLKSYRIIDHDTESGLDGLLTVVSVKYTTARDVAEKTVNLAQRKLGLNVTNSPTKSTPVHGGTIEDFEQFLHNEQSKLRGGLSAEQVSHLIANYGSAYSEILAFGDNEPSLLEPIAGDSPVLRAEVVHAVRNEMALSLADVVRRRTVLGSGCCPSPEALATCAEIMATELGWDQDETSLQLNETKALYVAEPGAQKARVESKKI